MHDDMTQSSMKTQVAQRHGGLLAGMHQRTSLYASPVVHVLRMTDLGLGKH